MSDTAIPDEVKNFIIENISSVGQLEVLLFLYLNRDKSWAAQKVGEEMRSSDAAAIQQLRELHSKHLVRRVGESGNERFQFEAKSVEQEEVVMELERYYGGFRVSIITLIYNKPVEVLRTFANAFLIRKDKK